MNPSVLLITETPPGTPNGFGVTLDTLLRNLHDNLTVFYTDAAFKKDGEERGYTLAQVPNHRGRRHWLSFRAGKTPEWRGRYSRRWLKQMLRRSKPDLVYSFLYSFSCLRFADWISHVLAVPHLPHIADHSEEFTVDSRALSILAQAGARAVIGENMKEHYENHLAPLDFHVLHNAPESDAFTLSPVSPKTFSSSSPFVLRFCGSIFANLHLEGVEDVMQTVRQMGEEGLPIRMELYGKVHPSNCLDKWLDGKHVTHVGSVKPSKRHVLLEGADAHLVPASFDPKRYEHYRLSIPTKLTEVLASGRPTLIYGPACMEAVRFCQREDMALIRTQRSTNILRDTLLDLVKNYPAYVKNAEKNAELIHSNYSAASMRTRFDKLLNEALAPSHLT